MRGDGRNRPEKLGSEPGGRAPVKGEEEKLGALRLIAFFTAAKLVLLVFSAALSGWSIERAMTRWDTQHYVNIAMNGYSSPQEYAFSPLFSSPF